MTTEEATEFRGFVEEFCNRMTAYGFDAIQVFASYRDEDGGWGHCAHGNGNVFAREGMARDWLIRQNQATRNSVGADE